MIGTIVPLILGGTGESYPGDTRTTTPQSMLKGVLPALTTNFEPNRWVGYPARYAQDGYSFEESVAEGVAKVKAVAAEILATPNRCVVLFGYSQGASIVRAFLEQTTDYRVLGAGQVADPTRREDEPVVGRNPGGFGILHHRPRPRNGAFVYQAAASRDPICSLGPNSLLRNLGDFTGYFSTDPKENVAWMRDAIDKLGNKRWQMANLTLAQRWDFRRLANAVDEASGYLPREIMIGNHPIIWNRGGGRHTCYGVEAPVRGGPSHLILLGQAVNTAANARMAAL